MDGQCEVGGLNSLAQGWTSLKGQPSSTALMGSATAPTSQYTSSLTNTAPPHPSMAWCPHSCASHCLSSVPQWMGKGPLQARGHHLGPGGTGHQVALCSWLEDAGCLPLHQLQPPSQWEQLAPPSPNPAGPVVGGSREQTHQIALRSPVKHCRERVFPPPG